MLAFISSNAKFSAPISPSSIKKMSVKQQKQSIVIESGTRSRLDTFLAKTEPFLSRSNWKNLIQSKCVTVNGCFCKPNYTLKPTDHLEWTLPELAPNEPQPEDIPLTILFEDSDLIVLNKSVGCVIHPAPGHETGTLVNALLFHAPFLKDIERAGIVHRLDKDTTGVLVVAKTDVALTELKRQFKERETDKIYLALVWGLPPKEGRIETLIGRHPVHRKKMAVLKETGKTAITTYQTLETFKETTLLQVKIETGRTHQIRVHLTHLGYPIIGDATYGRGRKKKGIPTVSHQMLHAQCLKFKHPITAKELSFEAPIPDDMYQFLNLLRETNHA